MKVYLANGLFSEADFRYNEFLANDIRGNIEGVDLFLPQEQGINDKTSFADSIAIYNTDKEALMSSDLLIAVIDGVEIDSGVACEIGMFSTTNRPIIGIYTDCRQHGRSNDKKIQALIDCATENQFMYRNLFVVGAIKSNGYIIYSTEELITKLKDLNSIHQ